MKYRIPIWALGLRPSRPIIRFQVKEKLFANKIIKKNHFKDSLIREIIFSNSSFLRALMSRQEKIRRAKPLRKTLLKQISRKLKFLWARKRTRTYRKWASKLLLEKAWTYYRFKTKVWAKAHSSTATNLKFKVRIHSSKTPLWTI